MTKKDLRTGMVLTCKNGDRYLCIRDYPGHKDGVAINLDATKGFLDIDDYKEDLTMRSILLGDDFTIEKIEKSSFVCDIRRCFINESCDYKTIWTRSPSSERFDFVCVASLCNRSCFTVGKIYTWDNGKVVDDEGDEYTNWVEGTDIDKWYLRHFYKFVKVVK